MRMYLAVLALGEDLLQERACPLVAGLFQDGAGGPLLDDLPLVHEDHGGRATSPANLISWVTMIIGAALVGQLAHDAQDLSNEFDVQV